MFSLFKYQHFYRGLCATISCLLLESWSLVITRQQMETLGSYCEVPVYPTVCPLSV